MLLTALLSSLACQRHPEITTSMIEKDIIGKVIRGIVYERGMGINWRFDKEESRTIAILEANYQENKAVLIINIEARGVVKGFFGRTHVAELSGRIRLHYEWIVDQWNLLKVENLTFKVVKH